MRDIKFRQYLTDKKIMLSWDDLINQEHEDSETLEATLTEKFSNASEPMQFTGLYDKHKKPIYEGDILMYNNRPREIIWENGCLKLRLDFYSIIKWVEYSKYVEVIGNIYEHPKLLK